jgi:hypothetical protein
MGGRLSRFPAGPLFFVLQLSVVLCRLAMKGVVMLQRFRNRFRSREDMRDFFVMWAATVLGTVTVIFAVVVLVSL